MPKKLLPLLCLFAIPLMGKPTDPTIVHGEVNLSQVGDTLKVEASHHAIIDWKAFSLSSHETAQFIQPSSDACLLNRVTGKEISQLLGTLQSNGHVFLINPQGVIIGKDAIINTGSFTASTLDILNSDFLEDKLHFKGLSEAPIINYGTIQAWNGDISLLGFNVENSGTITAPKGVASLLQGRDILLSPHSEERVFIRLSTEEKKEGAGLSNTGTTININADITNTTGNPFFVVNPPTTLGSFLNIAPGVTIEITGISDSGVMEIGGGTIFENISIGSISGPLTTLTTAGIIELHSESLRIENTQITADNLVWHSRKLEIVDSILDVAHTYNGVQSTIISS